MQNTKNFNLIPIQEENSAIENAEEVYEKLMKQTQWIQDAKKFHAKKFDEGLITQSELKQLYEDEDSIFQRKPKIGNVEISAFKGLTQTTIDLQDPVSSPIFLSPFENKTLLDNLMIMPRTKTLFLKKIILR